MDIQPDVHATTGKATMAKHSQQEGTNLYGPPAWCPDWVVGVAVLIAVLAVLLAAVHGGTF